MVNFSGLWCHMDLIWLISQGCGEFLRVVESHVLDMVNFSELWLIFQGSHMDFALLSSQGCGFTWT